MTRIVALGVVGILLATASGCGRSPDTLMTEWIADLNRFADAIEKGEPAARQKELVEKAKATEAKIEKLNQSPEQKKALAERHKDEWTKAILRVEAATKSPNFQLTIFGVVK